MKEQPLFPSITFLPCTSVDSHGRLDPDDFLREFRCFSYYSVSAQAVWVPTVIVSTVFSGHCARWPMVKKQVYRWRRSASERKKGEHKKKKKKKNNPPRYQEKNNNRATIADTITHTQGGTQSSNGPDRPWRIRRLPSVWGPYSLLPLFLLFFLCRCPVCCWSFVLPMRIISINYRRHRPFSLSRQRFYFYFFTTTVFAIHMASFFIYPRLTTESWMLNLFRCSKQWHCTFFNYLNIIY